MAEGLVPVRDAVAEAGPTKRGGPRFHTRQLPVGPQEDLLQDRGRSGPLQELKDEGGRGRHVLSCFRLAFECETVGSKPFSKILGPSYIQHLTRGQDHPFVNCTDFRFV